MRSVATGAHRHEQEGPFALSWKMYAVQARFASITTFYFAQKEPKSLPQDMFTGSEYT